MAFMLYGASSFNSDVSSWDTSSVTDMDGMFKGPPLQQRCVVLGREQRPVHEFDALRGVILQQHVSAWDVSSVSWLAYDMHSDVSSWDTSSVATIQGMFIRATLFNSNVSSWNVSSVTDMEGMFNGAASFNSDLSSWITSNVTTMIMPTQGSSFNSDVSLWDVSRVTNMEGVQICIFLYRRCVVLGREQRPVHDLDVRRAYNFNSDVSSDVSSVTDMEEMFYGASAFNSDVSAWDVSNIGNVESFYGAAAFNRPLSGWDVSGVLYMREMFQHAEAFDQDLCWKLNSEADTTEMFSVSSGSYSYSYSDGDSRVRTGCVKCGAGEYRVDNATCGRCPAGHYAEEPTDGSTGAVKCTACPAASPMTLVGATSDDECVAACDAGLLLSITEDGLNTSCVASCPSWAPADDKASRAAVALLAHTYQAVGACRAAPAITNPCVGR